jgi:hypothetical protein
MHTAKRKATEQKGVLLAISLGFSGDNFNSLELQYFQSLASGRAESQIVSTCEEAGAIRQGGNTIREMLRAVKTYDGNIPSEIIGNYVTARDSILYSWHNTTSMHVKHTYLACATAVYWFRVGLQEIAKIAYGFLQLHGYINFGVVCPQRYGALQCNGITYTA